MDYEKKYREALEWARKVMQGKVGFVLDEVLEKFPELKESEDERIRKEIIEQINLLKSATLSDLRDKQFDSWIAWLEKQAEHANFRNKIQIGDKVTRNRDGYLVNLSQLNRVAKIDEKQGEQKPNYCHREVDLSECSEEYCKAYYDGWNNCNMQHSQLEAEQKPAWSEEDEYCINQLIVFCDKCMAQDAGAKRCAHWLKSLKPQNRWKPSDEQMEALANALSLAKNCGEDNAFDLRTLHEQLKKLREE